MIVSAVESRATSCGSVPGIPPVAYTAPVSIERNWAANLTYQADSLVQPTTIDQLQEQVAAAPKVKALGTRHSFTDVADSPHGIQIDLSRLEPTVTVDHDGETATVTASMSRSCSRSTRQSV